MIKCSSSTAGSTTTAETSTADPDSPELPGVFNIVRVLSVAAGFSLSAGWDWFPAMHPLWLREFLYLDEPTDPVARFGSLSGFIFIKTLILLALGILLERLIVHFLVHRKDFFVAEDSEKPHYSKLQKRFYCVLPFAMVQLCAFFLILFLTFFLPIDLLDLIPVLLGSISALLGLLWFTIMAALPANWCCLSYGLAALCSLGLSLLINALPFDHLLEIRLICPLLALPLLFTALPSTDTILNYVNRHQYKTSPSTSPLPETSLCKPICTLFERIKPSIPGAGLYLFTLMYGLQLLLGFASGSFVSTEASPALGLQSSFVLGAEALGAFLVVWLIPRQTGKLIIPMLGLALFGMAALGVSLVSGKALLVPSMLLYTAGGGCAAFGISLLGMFFRARGQAFRTTAWGLFLLNTFGYFGGYALWVFINRMEHEALPYQELYVQFLALVSLAGMLSLYAMRHPLGKLLDLAAARTVDSFPPIDFSHSEKMSETPEELPEDLPDEVSAPDMDQPLLTRREREVTMLVQQGMKNLEISSRLNITETTLRVHLRRVYKKLGVQGRSALRGVSLDKKASGER